MGSDEAPTPRQAGRFALPMLGYLAAVAALVTYALI